MAGKHIFFCYKATNCSLYILMKLIFKKKNWNHLEYLNNKMAKHVKYIPFYQVKEFLFVTVYNSGL